MGYRTIGTCPDTTGIPDASATSSKATPAPPHRTAPHRTARGAWHDGQPGHPGGLADRGGPVLDEKPGGQTGPRDAPNLEGD